MALDTVLALLFCLKTEVFHCYELNLIFRMTSSFQACVRYRGSNRTPEDDNLGTKIVTNNLEGYTHVTNPAKIS